MLVVRWEGGMVLVVQVIVGVWAAWVGWGRGEVVVMVVAHRQVGNPPLKSFWLRSHFGSRKLHATKMFGAVG